MIRRFSTGLCVVFVTAILTAHMDAAERENASASAATLKDAFQGAFLIGAALDVGPGSDSSELAIAAKEFNAFTPENSMKPASVQPVEGRFNFAGSDRLVELAEKNGATPIGHCLVWHSQTPQWFFQGSDRKPVDRELALARMRKHIATVVGHYKGRVKQWDVVNEALGDAPNEYLRQSPWFKAIGEDYIAEAFRAAHSADPDAILTYNDYNIETGEKHRKALRLLQSLIEKQVPIHAVGIQAHWRLDELNLAEVEESIKRFAALGLKVMITELDIGALPTQYRGADVWHSENMNADQRTALNPYVDGLPDAVAQKHAARFREAFEIFLRNKESIGRVTLWGIDDGRSWLNNFPIRGRTDYPLLFDREGKPKPAFFAVMKVAEEAKNGKAAKRASNPVIWADVPDPSILRVGNVYYMSSTTMHLSPGLPIMKSKDLVNWELIGYVYETLGDNDALNLQNGKNAYGQGSWASSLRYRDGVFYATTFSSTTGKTHVFTTKDIEKGPWKESAFSPMLHDHSLFFDDDGRTYMVYGGGDIRIVELTADASAIKPGGVNQIIVKNASRVAGEKIGLPAEGSHLEKINGKYYLFNITWPRNDMRTQIVHRADKITGPYEGKVIFHDQGVAQGSLVDTQDGRWFAYLFQDHGAVGRVPFLIPAKWEDGWPVLGEEGKTPMTLNIPSGKEGLATITASDEFERRPDAPSLPLAWQWNHNPDNRHWSLTARPGWLRLTTGRTESDLCRARNSLTQRTFGPQCSGVTKLDASGMKDGDVAGLSAFQRKYGFVAVKASETGKSLVMTSAENGEPVENESIPLKQDVVYLRVDCDFRDRADKAYFYYRLDGKAWTKIGKPLKMDYTLPHFMGYRFALFNFAAKTAEGYADFDYFHVAEKFVEEK